MCRGSRNPRIPEFKSACEARQAVRIEEKSRIIAKGKTAGFCWQLWALTKRLRPLIQKGALGSDSAVEGLGLRGEPECLCYQTRAHSIYSCSGVCFGGPACSYCLSRAVSKACENKIPAGTTPWQRLPEEKACLS